jgi:exopolyphosphatase / guanosine-5'-triphosphate,3'-diphosphate pyrophosphatase
VAIEGQDFTRFAAINIGSNAVRLLVSNVFETFDGPVFKKAELFRLPVRLGDNSFIDGKISPQKIDKLLKAMRAYKELIGIYEPLSYRVCATSAMREASNSQYITDQIYKETGFKVEIIDGKTEADIIYSNHVAEKLDKNNSYLYIDVGGGSTEVSLFSKNRITASNTFKIGTIRLLYNSVSKEYWNDFKEWVKEATKGCRPIVAIGSGGNINKLFKMTGKKDNNYISYSKLKQMSETLNSYTLDERIQLLDLNPDRADVIVPASKIYLTIMKIADIEKIYIPQIGLSDGIVRQLYYDYKEKQK